MTVLLNPFRFTAAAVIPLTIAWHHAFWASDPSWTNPGADTAVSSWRDASGNGNTATQPTGGKQPIYRASSASLGNKPIIEFDGVDDYLATAVFATVPQPTELFVVCRFRSVVNSSRVLDNASSTHRQLLFTSSAGKWGISAGTVLASATAVDTTKHAVRAVFDTTDEVFLDGSSIVSGDAGSQDSTGLVVGASSAFASPGAVDIAFIGQKAGLLTTQERSDLLAWSQSFYGTP